MSLAYYPVIIFPFLFNKRLSGRVIVILPFIVFTLGILLINNQNLMLYILGMLRYVYFFLLIILLGDERLNIQGHIKVFSYMMFIGLIQFPVSLINMTFLYKKMNIAFIDSGGGTFGPTTSGLVAIYLVIFIYALIIYKNGKRNKRNYLYIAIMLLGLTVTYSGGGIVILAAVLVVYTVLIVRRIKILIVTAFLVSMGGIFFLYSHGIMIKLLPKESAIILAEYGNIGSYAARKAVNTLSLINERPSGNSRREKGRIGIIESAWDYSNKKGIGLIGSGPGSFNKAGALGKYIDIAELTLFNKVFGPIKALVNQYAIMIGEIGVVGIFFMMLLVYKITIGKSELIYRKYKFPLYLILLMYSYYEVSIWNYQIIFIWGYVIHNIKFIVTAPRIIKS